MKFLEQKFPISEWRSQAEERRINKLTSRTRFKLALKLLEYCRKNNRDLFWLSNKLNLPLCHTKAIIRAKKYDITLMEVMRVCELLGIKLTLMLP